MTPQLAALAERPSPRRLRVLAVDDQPLFLEALAVVLSVAPDLEVVGRAGDGIEGIQQALALRPDVVLMDLDMPRMDGVEATRRIVGELPGTAVVMVTGSDLAGDVARSSEAGAVGYVTKDRLANDLLAAIRGAGRLRTA
jgi:DNA-binding NarL/FixJ family response regulator